MKNITTNFAALIKVKTIVTFVVIVVYAVLALRGDITPENVQNITLMVIAFYFGTQLEKSNAETVSDHSLCPFMNQGFGDTEGTDESVEDGGDLNV